MTKNKITSSVRDIVDFIYATGDLQPAFVALNQMQEGTRLHQKVEKDYAEYLSEVYVKVEGDYLGYPYMVQGRIDLLHPTKTKLIEIKSTNNLERNDFEESHPNHFAQAKFYGYMLYEMGKINRTETLDVTVLYVHRTSYKARPITKTYRYDELEAFFFNTLRQYIEFHHMINQFKDHKMESIQQLDFPYPSYRKGQDKLVDVVQEKIELREDLFVNAPTGIGKSLGTVYPSFKALSSKQEQIFYLTAKSTVKTVADETVELLREKSGLKCKSIVLTAKEKICINDEMKCNPVDCSFAKDFYKKLKDAITDIYEHEDRWDERTISSYALKHEICPFEYQLSLTTLSDIIIGDYNYVFDPRVYLKRFFDDPQPQLILLIDEAHNLYDRVTDMYTVSISPELIRDLLMMVYGESNLEMNASRILKILEDYRHLCQREGKDYLSFQDLDETLLSEVNNLVKKTDKFFEQKRDSGESIPEELLNIYYDLLHFLRISDYFNEDFIVWIECTKDTLLYQISCLNPKELIRNRTESVLSIIFFSATLHPMDYYKYLYGGDDASHVLIDSPFDPDQLELIVNANISTKYRDRVVTRKPLAKAISEVVCHPGKYLVYFPSYQYLDLAAADIIEELGDEDIQIIKQKRGMGERMREDFINQFDTSDKHIVGLAVLGGSFAEGIDLVGDRLNGAVVVGVGLPTFNAYRKELQAYFYRQGLNGYLYAFTYPGFNKVLQAVGRVIRSETDYGIALLIDSRYKNHEYLSLFPPHWSHFRWSDER